MTKFVKNDNKKVKFVKNDREMAKSVKKDDKNGKIGQKKHFYRQWKGKIGKKSIFAHGDCIVRVNTRNCR